MSLRRQVARLRIELDRQVPTGLTPMDTLGALAACLTRPRDDAPDERRRWEEQHRTVLEKAALFPSSLGELVRHLTTTRPPTPGRA